MLLRRTVPYSEPQTASLGTKPDHRISSPVLVRASSRPRRLIRAWSEHGTGAPRCARRALSETRFLTEAQRHTRYGPLLDRKLAQHTLEGIRCSVGLLDVTEKGAAHYLGSW